MPNWTESMRRTYEYYIVDPNTWKNKSKLDNVKSTTIDWDLETDTLGSASIDISETLNECYVRVYLVTEQNDVTEKFALGTFLVQTPYSTFDGKKKDITMDAYTPLIELKENMPPLGYSILKGDNIMDRAYTLTRENCRAPVVKPSCTDTLYFDFVANTDDTWMSFNSDLISNAKHYYGLDEMGRVLFLPKQNTASLQPVWTYTDDNCSILNPRLTVNHDLYGIPNVVEVVYSNGKDRYYSRVVNDDENSPISTVNRGREILYRITDPSIVGDPTQKQIDEYARQTLVDLSTVEYSISYTHGYCPVRIGDCVRFNLSIAGLKNIKAKVISQQIKCTADCQVSETAVFTTKLWG